MIRTESDLRDFIASMRASRRQAAPHVPAPGLSAATIDPATLASLRAEGTVYRCLDCDFIGIGRPVTYHPLVEPDHRIVTEKELAAADCLECGANTLRDDEHATNCSHHPNFFEPRDGGCYQ